MDTNILHWIIDISLAVVSYSVWKKYRDNSYLWFMWIAISAGLVNIFDYVLENIIHVSVGVRLVSGVFSMVFLIVATILAVVVLFKLSRKGKKVVRNAP